MSHLEPAHRRVPADQPHPLPTLLDAGLLVTLNSDDPPIFATTLTDEYRPAHRMGLRPAELVALARNGVRASFLDDPAKSALLTEIDTVAADHGPLLGSSLSLPADGDHRAVYERPTLHDRRSGAGDRENRGSRFGE